MTDLENARRLLVLAEVAMNDVHRTYDARMERCDRFTEIAKVYADLVRTFSR